MVESDKNIMPRVYISPLDVIKAIGSALVDLCSVHQLSTVSDHKFIANHGASEMLDAAMDSDPVVIENLHRSKNTQLEFVYPQLEL